jgi:hypothetical protein
LVGRPIAIATLVLRIVTGVPSLLIGFEPGID